jgi:hypothetical protein
MATASKSQQDTLQGLAQGSSSASQLLQPGDSSTSRSASTRRSARRVSSSGGPSKNKSTASATAPGNKQTQQASPSPSSRPRTALLEARNSANLSLLKAATESRPKTATTSGMAPKTGSVKKKKDSVPASAAVRARLAAMNASPDPFALNRSGRQFTVGHIGTGGAIYLRYV